MHIISYSIGCLNGCFARKLFLIKTVRQLNEITEFPNHIDPNPNPRNRPMNSLGACCDIIGLPNSRIPYEHCDLCMSQRKY